MKVIQKRLNVNFTLFNFLLLAGILLFSLNSNAEGTKQVIPPGSAPTPPSIIGAYGSLALTTGTTYSSFANFNATADYRLYIHIENTFEKILFGFQKETNSAVIKFNIHEPVSPFNVVFSGTVPSAAGTGYIQDLSHAYAGPFPASGGYTPFEVTPTMSGDWFIEFFTSSGTPIQNSAVGSNLLYFDITVLSSGYQTPPVPTDARDGRVWSKSWQFNSKSITLTPDQHFAGSTYVYSNDGIVTKIDFNKMIAGTFMVFCNPKGVQNLTDPIQARKSREGNYKYPDYKVFLNDPDPAVYPSGTPGTISTNPAPTMVPAPPPCSGNEVITFSVSQDGKVDITLDLPPPYVDKIFTQVDVVSGSNSIAWDGLDGGTPAVPVADGTSVTMSINYLNGLTNLPLYDVEYTANTNYSDQGLKVTLVRPTTGVQTPRMYWDDDEVNKTSTTCHGTVNTTAGCVPSIVTPTDGCHKWSTCLGNVNTINTWWYAANSSTGSIIVEHAAEPPNPVGINNSRCGSGAVIINATVLNNEVVDWYSDPSGTNLLQSGTAGNTNFTTPALTVSTTYYAKARNLTTACLSPGLTPVVAEVFNTPNAPTGTTTVSVCGSQSVLLTATVDPGQTIEWWDALTGGNSLGTNLTYITPLLGPGSYTYYAEAVAAQPICNRSTRTPFHVSIKPVPVITLVNPPASICTGTTTNLNLNTVFTSTLPGTTYEWSVLPGNCINILICPANNSGTFINDLLTLTNPINNGQAIYNVAPIVNGCLGIAAAITVTVSPLPSPAGPISPSLPEECQSKTVLYSIVPLPNTNSYSWNVTPSGAASQTIVNPVTPYEATITWSETFTGSAIIHVYGSNGCGNGAEQTLSLTIRPKPVMLANLCENIITTTQGRLIKMKWGLPPGGEYSGTGINTTDKLTFDPKNAGSSGTKVITYTYTNQYLCTNSATMNIELNIPPAFSQCGVSSITDVRNSTSYATFMVGGGASAKCWMARNLNFGTMVADNTPQANNCISEKYCYQSDALQCANRGASYQWDEMMQYQDPLLGYQDICPPGWHVPTRTEWQALIDYVAGMSQGDGIAGSFLTDANPASGFHALLDGVFYMNNFWAFTSGTLNATMFWTSTTDGTIRAIARGMNNFNYSVSFYPSSRANAFPVRCVKD